MNGRFPSPDKISGRSGASLDQHRLAAALAISCLLHLTLLVAPYLGESTREGPRPAEAERGFLRAFSASLKAAQVPIPLAVNSTAADIEPAEGTGILPFSAPAYYPTNQLTKRPQPLGSADLEAPETSLIVASGKLILTLWIDEFGEVKDVVVEKTELPEVFSRSAIAAFKHLRFTAGERSGVRVGSMMRIEVNYDDARSPAP